MSELTLQEAALAWAQGKRVECLTVNQTEYLPISRVGTSDGIISPTCFGDLDEDRIHYKFRLAPEPPAKKFRPWKPEEVPVGALVRFGNGKTGNHCWMITGWNAVSFHTSNSVYGPVLFEEAERKGCQHSLDNGKTWLPCVVEVKA